MAILKNVRHELFAQAIAKQQTAEAAYISAGFTPNRGNATRLKQKESIIKRVAEIQERAARRSGITIDRITEELAKIGFANITEALKFNGKKVTLTDSDKLDPDVTAAISEVRQTKDGIAIKFHDKRAALVDLGKHFGYFKENVNLNVTLSLSDLVLASYQPAQESLPAPEMKQIEGKTEDG